MAAGNSQLTAAIAQTPNADGPAATRNAIRYQKPLAMARTMGRAVLDALGGLLGRPPRLIALDGPPGTVALLTTPDAAGGGDALDPDGIYPDWQQAVANVRCPLLVVVCDDDRSALAEPSVAAATRAPRGELVRLPGGHYAPFLDQHEQAVEAELAFLRRELLDA